MIGLRKFRLGAADAHGERTRDEALRMSGLLLRVEDAHDVTKALGIFRDLEF